MKTCVSTHWYLSRVALGQQLEPIDSALCVPQAGSVGGGGPLINAGGDRWLMVIRLWPTRAADAKRARFPRHQRGAMTVVPRDTVWQRKYWHRECWHRECWQRECWQREYWQRKYWQRKYWQRNSQHAWRWNRFSNCHWAVGTGRNVPKNGDEDAIASIWKRFR